MKVTVLAGGVGGAKFLRGLRDHLHSTTGPEEPSQITAVINTGDDMWLTGLRVCPDLDSVMYALAGVNDTARGWGRGGESERVSSELTAYGLGWPWFTLGDLDLGTHIARSHLLREGCTLTDATARLARRWDIGVTLLPMSDDPVETHVVIDDPEEPGSESEIHFEEWWVRLRASVPARRFVQHGLPTAVPAPGVTEAIHDADAVIIAPSNPVVSIGTMLNVPGIRDAVARTGAPVVGVSPVIGGAPVRGMAGACLAAIGVETTADAIGLHYGSRRDGGILDGWLIDSVDARRAAATAAAGIPTLHVPLWMNDDQTSSALAADALSWAGKVAEL